MKINNMNSERTDLLFSLVLTFPCCWAVFPTPVHAIKQTKHAWEASFFVDQQNTLQVVFSRVLEVFFCVN
jgi:hypothetical protein